MLQARAKHAAVVAISIAFALALAAHASGATWLLGAERISSTAASSLALAALALLLLRCGRRQSGTMLGVISGGVGLAVLARHLVRASLGLDPVPLSDLVGSTWSLGGVSVGTALVLLLLAAECLILGGFGGQRSRQHLVPFLGIMIIGLGLVESLTGIEPGLVGGLPLLHEHGLLTGSQVLLGMALMLVSVADSSSLQPRRWAPVLCGVCMVGITLLLWRGLATRERGLIDRMTQVEAAQVRAELDDGLEAILYDLTHTARLWQRRPPQPGFEWAAEAAELLRHHPGAMSLVRLDADDRVLQSCALVPLPEGALESLDLGRPAEDRAPATDPPTARLLGPWTLPDLGDCLVAVVDIREGGRPVGRLAEVLSVEDLFRRLLAERGPRFSIAIDAGTHEIYRRYAASRYVASEPLTVLPLEALGPRLRVRVWPTPALPASLRSSLPEVVLCLALPLGVLIMLAVHFRQTARHRTRELVASNRRLEQQIGERRRMAQDLQGAVERLDRQGRRLQRLAGASLSMQTAGSLDVALSVVGEEARRVMDSDSAEIRWRPDAAGAPQTGSPLPRIEGDRLVAPLLGADGVGAGQIEVARSPQGHPDEDDITLLAQFAQLAGAAIQVHCARHELEQRVLERTRELARSNESVIQTNRKLLQEVAERRQTEEALAQSEERYRTLVQASAAVVWTADPDGGFERPQEEWARYTGQEWERHAGHGWTEAIHPDDRGPLLEAWEHALREVQSFEVECRLWSGPHRQHRHCVARAIPLRNARGRDTVVREWIGAFEDVDDRRRAERELEHAHAKLTRAHEELQLTQLQVIQAARSESIGDLAAGVAHEVKNPLSVILLGLDYLVPKLQELPPRQLELLEDMRCAVVRADSVIRGLMDFASPREVCLDDCDLNTLIDEALPFVRGDLLNAHVNLVTRFAEGLPRICIDHQKVQQVIVNLIVNACHAIGNNGTITVTTREARLEAADIGREGRDAEQFAPGDRVVLCTIEDSGPGIPPDVLERIFEPFFTTKPTGQGTGLGLSVSRTIIELHHGALDIHNRAEGGACVTLTLRAPTLQEQPS